MSSKKRTRNILEDLMLCSKQKSLKYKVSSRGCYHFAHHPKVSDVSGVLDVLINDL